MGDGNESPTPTPPKPLRLNVTLDGEFAEDFRAEMARGGGPSEVLRRHMDRARARSVQVARADVRSQLQAIREHMDLLKLKSRDPDLLEAAAETRQAVERAGRILGQMAGQ